MKRVLFILFLTFATVCFSKQSPWVFHRNYGDTDIFLSREGNTRLVLSHKTTTKKIDLSQKEEFYKEIEKDKKRALTFTGVHDWKATNYNLEQKENFKILTIDGSYIDSKSNKVYFHEVHYYAKGKFLQILATNPDKKLLKQSFKDNSLSGFKVKYGFSH